MLYELYGVKIDSSQIKQNIMDYRNNQKIYFIDMEKDLYGLTLLSGDILINNYYFYPKRKTCVFIVFLTLFHEYSHILSRLLRGNNNFIGEFLKNNKSKNLKCAGKWKLF